MSQFCINTEKEPDRSQALALLEVNCGWGNKNDAKEAQALQNINIHFLSALDYPFRVRIACPYPLHRRAVQGGIN